MVTVARLGKCASRRENSTNAGLAIPISDYRSAALNCDLSCLILPRAAIISV